MEMLWHLIFFLISSVFIVLAWIGFLFLNNIINKIDNMFIREIMGGGAVVLLFAAVGLIIYQTAISFFIGMVLAITLLLVIYFGKKGISALMVQS